MKKVIFALALLLVGCTPSLPPTAALLCDLEGNAYAIVPGPNGTEARFPMPPANPLCAKPVQTQVQK